jgi:hypothetical protein
MDAAYILRSGACGPVPCSVGVSHALLLDASQESTVLPHPAASSPYFFT